MGNDAAATSQPTGRLASTFRALRHRNFQLFFAGQFVSLTGTWMQTVAQSWLVYQMTGSVILLGTIGFASQIPVLLLAPLVKPASSLVDALRAETKKQLAVSELDSNPDLENVKDRRRA